jgi:hypothetical protein
MRTKKRKRLSIRWYVEGYPGAPKKSKSLGIIAPGLGGTDLRGWGAGG